jgi:hypothetical protein
MLPELKLLLHDVELSSFSLHPLPQLLLLQPPLSFSAGSPYK